MAAGVVQLRPIDGSHFKHAVEKSDTGLFVHLRALRQRGGHAEVVQLEHFCAALGTDARDLRSMDLSKILGKHELPEAAGESLLDAEYRAFPGMTQRHGAVLHFGAQRGLQLFIGQVQRQRRSRTGQNGEAVEQQLHAVFSAGFGAQQARCADTVACGKLAQIIIRTHLLVVHGLNEITPGAQHHECDAAKLPDVVNARLEGDFLPGGGQQLCGGRTVPDLIAFDLHDLHHLFFSFCKSHNSSGRPEKLF